MPFFPPPWLQYETSEKADISKSPDYYFWLTSYWFNMDTKTKTSYLQTYPPNPSWLSTLQLLGTINLGTYPAAPKPGDELGKEIPTGEFRHNKPARLKLINSSLEQLQKFSATSPLGAISSIIAQLEYLKAIEEGTQNDYSKRKDLSMGITLIRNLEGTLPARLESDIHMISYFSQITIDEAD